MQLTPREFDKLLIYMMAEVALKRKTKGLKLNYPEAVAIISAVALDGARAGKTIEEVTKDARSVLTKKDVMDTQRILYDLNARVDADYQIAAKARLSDMFGSF